MPPNSKILIFFIFASSTIYFIYVFYFGCLLFGKIFVILSETALSATCYSLHSAARTKRKFRTTLCLILSISTSILLVVLLYHYVNAQDYRRSCKLMSTLPSRTDDQHVHSIFFLQTSTNPIVSSRTACAIESAALHHPKWTITLYNVSAIDEDISLQTLQELPNFRLRSINLTAFYKNSLLWDWYQAGDFASSPFASIKLSDCTRYLLLYKNGGIYLDTDVIVLRPMHQLRNSVGLEHMFSVNNAVLVFDKQHPFLRTVIENIEQSYTSDSWGTEGPKLFTRLLPEVCSNASSSSKMASFDYMIHPELCSGFSILPSYAFYPLWFFPVPGYNVFRAEADARRDLSCSYTLHLMNSQSRDWHSRVGSTQLMDVLARENCPNVYQKAVKSQMVGI